MSGYSDAAKDYFAGMLSGVAMVLVGHPFDTVKVHLQTQNTGVHGHRYRGALHCSSHILRTEGVRGLYKGATSSFIGFGLESCILFGAYTQLKVSLQGGSRGSPSLSTTLLAAGTSGAAISTILCPTELVKCRLQVQAKRNPSLEVNGKQKVYKGPWDVIRKTMQQEGAGGLFRGFQATALRESIGNCVYFCIYENFRFYMLQTFCGRDGLHVSQLPSQDSAGGSTSETGDSEWLRGTVVETGTALISGGCAGVGFWLTVLPLDVVKTRIQTAKDLPSPTGTFHLLRMLYKEAGLKSLYAGLGPTVARAFPANAAAIATWECTARFLGVGPSHV